MLFSDQPLGNASLLAMGGICPQPFRASEQEEPFADLRLPAVFTRFVKAEQVMNPDQFEAIVRSEPHKYGPPCGSGRCQRCSDVESVRAVFATSSAVRLMPVQGQR